MHTFDFIIVGAGTAGSLLANRLSADGATVCVLEAGPRDLHPYIHIPAGYIKNVYSKHLTWNFESAPSPHVNSRSFSLPQGRVLGGSSSINGLNHVRGQASDYDGWARAGATGWSYAEVLPYFMRSECRIGGSDAVRGRTGEIPVTDLDWRHPLCAAFIDGVAGLGIPVNPDYNSGDQAGVGYFQRTIRRGLRYSAARAFLGPARKRDNVDIRTHAQATAIVFEGTRAVGVRYLHGGPGGTPREVRARREVIVAAGAINTPKLLHLSGVGPAEVIKNLGLPVIRDLAGVGRNLRDHYGVRMVARLQGIKTINDLVQGPPLAWQVVRWMLGLPSPIAISPSLVHVFWKSNAGLSAPDLQYVFTPASFRAGVVGLLDKFPGITLGVWQERPESLGYVRTVSRDPSVPPEIQPNYLAHEGDRRVLLDGMREGFKMLATPPLQPWLVGRIAPAPELRSDAELLDWARANGTTVYHMIGTARMGSADDPQCVVDHELKVIGLQNLRIADASVMPSMPSGNTNAPVLMIAEKAADLILGKRVDPVIPLLGAAPSTDQTFAAPDVIAARHPRVS